MKWSTAISVHKNGELYVRGVSLIELIKEASLVEAIFLVLAGRRPKKNEEKMLEAVLISMIEHGIEVPSAFVARSVASTGNPTNSALAAGVLAIGDFHGGAIEKAAFYFQSSETSDEIVTKALQKKEHLPGYGHKIYKTEDPRVTTLFKKAEQLKLAGRYLSRARDIEKKLARQSGKTIPLNVDGAIAAIICELGFDWRLGKSFFVLGRLPGLIAHVAEENRNEKPYRRLEPEDIEYNGPALKI